MIEVTITDEQSGMRENVVYSYAVDLVDPTGRRHQIRTGTQWGMDQDHAVELVWQRMAEDLGKALNLGRTIAPTT